MPKIFDQLTADTLFLKGDHQAAFEMYFKGATEYHDSRAAFDLAYMYHRGFYVPVNGLMARKFYHAASAMDGGAALFNLALLHLRGIGGAVDFAAAYDCMKRAAADGCVDAQLYLGTAYTLGCVFDPINIECLSMIPFPRVIKRDPETMMLCGAGADAAMEDKRFEIIEADEVDAVEMFRMAASHKDDTYINEQIGAAKFTLGQALIEGVGMEYSPRKGYRLIERAAAEHDSKEAAHFLLTHREEARVYGIDAAKTAFLLGEKEGENS